MSCADFFWWDVTTEGRWSRHIDTGGEDSGLGTSEPNAHASGSDFSPSCFETFGSRLHPRLYDGIPRLPPVSSVSGVALCQHPAPEERLEPGTIKGGIRTFRRSRAS